MGWGSECFREGRCESRKLVAAVAGACPQLLTEEVGQGRTSQMPKLAFQCLSDSYLYHCLFELFNFVLRILTSLHDFTPTPVLDLLVKLS